MKITRKTLPLMLVTAALASCSGSTDTISNLSFFATATADSYRHEKYMPFMAATWNIPVTARIGSRSRAREGSIAARMALYAANDREKTGTAANTAISAAK